MLLMLLKGKEDVASNWYIDLVPMAMAVNCRTMKQAYRMISEGIEQGRKLDGNGARRVRTALNTIIAAFQGRNEEQPDDGPTLRSLEETSPEEQPRAFLERAWFSKHLLNALETLQERFKDHPPEPERNYWTSRIDEAEFEVIMKLTKLAFGVIEEIKNDNEDWYRGQPADMWEWIEAAGAPNDHKPGLKRFSPDSPGSIPSIDSSMREWIEAACDPNHHKTGLKGFRPDSPGSIPSMTSSMRAIKFTDDHRSQSRPCHPWSDSDEDREEEKQTKRKGKGKQARPNTDDEADREFSMLTAGLLSGIRAPRGSPAFSAAGGAGSSSRRDRDSSQDSSGGMSITSEDIKNLVEGGNLTRKGLEARQQSRSPPVSQRPKRDHDQSEGDTGKRKSRWDR